MTSIFLPNGDEIHGESYEIVFRKTNQQTEQIQVSLPKFNMPIGSMYGIYLPT